MTYVFLTVHCTNFTFGDNLADNDENRYKKLLSFFLCSFNNKTLYNFVERISSCEYTKSNSISVD